MEAVESLSDTQVVSDISNGRRKSVAGGGVEVGAARNVSDVGVASGCASDRGDGRA